MKIKIGSIQPSIGASHKKREIQNYHSAVESNPFAPQGRIWIQNFHVTGKHIERSSIW